MKRRRHQEDEPEDEVVYKYRRGLGARIGGLVLTVAIVTLILYGAALAVSRTDGFRSMVAEKVSDWSGLPVDIESASLTPGLDLVLNGLRTAEGEDGAELKISRARVEWSLVSFLTWGKSAVRAVDLQAGSIQFRPDHQGRWQPAWMHVPFVDMIEGSGHSLSNTSAAVTPTATGDSKPDGDTAAGLSTASAGAFWEDVALRIRDGHLTWQASDDRVAASVSGLNLTVTPLFAPLRTLHHFQAWMDDLRVGQERMQGVSLEFISVEDRQMVVALEAEWTGPESAAPPSREP